MSGSSQQSCDGKGVASGGNGGAAALLQSGHAVGEEGAELGGEGEPEAADTPGSRETSGRGGVEEDEVEGREERRQFPRVSRHICGDLTGGFVDHQR